MSNKPIDVGELLIRRLEEAHQRDVANCNAHRTIFRLNPRTNGDELDCKKEKCSKGCPLK